MFFPGLRSGIKQPLDLTRVRVNAGKVAALMKIAFGACQRQVVETFSAAVLARDDVIDVEGNQR